MARFGSGPRLLVLSVVLALFPQGNSLAAPQTVTIQDLAFNPKVVALTFGQEVTWKNLDKVEHTSNSKNISLWSSRLIREGQSFSFHFFGAGTFAYYCSLHPMFGKVKVAPVVSPRSGPAGTIVSVRWGRRTPALEFAYTVQKREPDGSWQDWQVKTTEESATFEATRAGTYAVRVMMLELDLLGRVIGESAYSPPRTFRAS